MSLPDSLLIHSVTWVVPTVSTDAYGNEKRAYGSGTTITCRMQQDQGTEPLAEGRDPLVRDWKMFTNQSGIGGYDRIVYGTLTFEVEGPPAPASDGAGFHHAEVALRLVTG